MRQHICLVFIVWVNGSLSAQGSGSAQPWWKQTVFYQIYMPSYLDSDASGYGDFKGMTTKLPYLQQLGVKGIWLTPFLKSPKVDNGYDVSDYYQVDPSYGTNQDFRTFLDSAHSLGIKVIMDMVLNHTSTDHYWFKESRKSRDNPYRDFYLWQDQPNNWESFFGGKAWEYDPATGQYYYHKFDVRMADLNWSNPEVRQEIARMLQFWLDMGVDGFRLDVINFLTTDGILQDNPVVDGKQQHQSDIDQAGVKEAIRFIRQTVSAYPDRFLVGEVGSDQIEVLKQYQGDTLLDVVFNFNFGSIPSFSSDRIFRELESMEEQLPGYPTLFFGSHDMPRMMDRLAEGNIRLATCLAALTLTAKGVPFVYYGEEIGMKNILAKELNDIVDIQGRTHYRLALESGKTAAEALEQANVHNRDKSRSPMQWDDSPQAGFTSGRAWIQVSPDYRQTNVARAMASPESIWWQYQRLIALRNAETVLQFGTYEKLESKDEVVRFVRRWKDEKITVVLNFGTTARKWELPEKACILEGAPELAAYGLLIYKESAP